MPYFGFTGSTFINMPWFSPSWFAVLLTRSTSWSSEMFFTSSHELGSIFDQQPVDSYPISEEARVYMVTPFTQPCPYPHSVLLQLIWRVGEPPAPWTFCFCSQNHFWWALFFSSSRAHLAMPGWSRTISMGFGVKDGRNPGFFHPRWLLRVLKAWKWSCAPEDQ